DRPRLFHCRRSADTGNKHVATGFCFKTFLHYDFDVTGQVDSGGETELVLFWDYCRQFGEG
ncbi:hypothetical protein L873DRAFT_1818364, partial [Choiromyces venosus 120613-1]